MVRNGGNTTCRVETVVVIVIGVIIVAILGKTVPSEKEDASQTQPPVHAIEDLLVRPFCLRSSQTHSSPLYATTRPLVLLLSFSRRGRTRPETKGPLSGQTLDEIRLAMPSDQKITVWPQ